MHSIQIAGKKIALERRKRIYEELKLGSDNDVTKIILKQIHKSNTSYEFYYKLEFYQIENLNRIQCI